MVGGPILWWLMALAWAQEPTVQVMADARTVQGVVEVDADAKTLRAIVQDAWRTKAAGDAPVVLVDKGRQGDCELVEYTIPHVLKTVQFTARVCPTATGSVISLVSSEDFEDYQSTFVIDELGPNRARVTYQIRTTPRFMVPRVLLNTQTVRGVTEYLRQMAGFVSSHGAR